MTALRSKHSVRIFGFALVFAVALPNVAGAQTATTKNPVPQLLKNLASDNAKAAASAARSLGVIFAPGGKGGEERDEVVNAMIGKLKSPLGADVRREAARGLGNIRATEAIDGIKEAMDDKDIEVAIAAGEAVGKILPVDDARAFLTKRGAEKSLTVKAAAYNGIAPIAKPEDAEFLVTGLAVDNWRVKKGAIDGLHRAARAGAELKPETYDAIATVLGYEILNAARAASHFFHHVRNSEAQQALYAALDIRGDGSKEDKTWRLRAYALRTVNGIGWPANRGAMPGVIRNLGDRTTNVTNQAKNYLIYIRKNRYLSRDSIFEALLAELENAEPLPLRAGIMAEMHGYVPTQHASRVAKVATKALTDAMEDKSAWPARTHAITLLGASETTGAVSAVVACVDDLTPNVRQAAGRALGRLGPLCTAEEKAKVAPVLLSLLEKPVDWRKTAIAARAAGYFPTDKAVEPLTKLLGHSVVNVRDGASDALVRMVGDDDAKLRDTIEKTVNADLARSARGWEHGAKVLGALENPAAVELLTKILGSSNWRARTNAADAVAKIAADHKLADKPLNDALIRASQSDTLQLQDAANRALRAISRKTEG